MRKRKVYWRGQPFHTGYVKIEIAGYPYNCKLKHLKLLRWMKVLNPIDIQKQDGLYQMKHDNTRLIKEVIYLSKKIGELAIIELNKTKRGS